MFFSSQMMHYLYLFFSFSLFNPLSFFSALLPLSSLFCPPLRFSFLFCCNSRCLLYSPCKINELQLWLGPHLFDKLHRAIVGGVTDKRGGCNTPYLSKNFINIRRNWSYWSGLETLSEWVDLAGGGGMRNNWAKSGLIARRNG